MIGIREKRSPSACGGILAGVLAVTLLAGAPAFAQAPPTTGNEAAGGSGHAPCFFLRDWKRLWKATADARTIYISVSHRVYRLDLAVAYPLLKSRWAVLHYRDSSSTVCSPTDLQLVVSDRLGVHEDVIVRKLTLLTPTEAASLPKHLRP
ncbi:MAG: hypothetical protein ACRETB_09545 [Steroidobacteraceae bacterium]